MSVFAMVLVPLGQVGALQAQAERDEDGKFTDVYPVNNVKFGARVYASEGCVSCHSQQVRDLQNGYDQDRGWGVRRTVARDYIYDLRPFLGSSRLGPDLANAGATTWRNESDSDPRRPRKRDAAWHYLHLYQPTAAISESNMPPYRYLFEERKIGGQRSSDALPEGVGEVKPGYELVPTGEARQLVAYLLSLDRSHPLKEVKSPAPKSAPAAK